MTTTPQVFIHRYEAGAASLPPLLLLHSEGDDEMQLLSLAHAIEPQAAIVAVRGKVLAEGGKARFSSPPGPGGARASATAAGDLDDIDERATELAEFLEALRRQYHLRAPVAVGHANGAYMAAALLLRHSGALAGAALLRPGATLTGPIQHLNHTPVLMVSGAHDQGTTREVRRALRHALQMCGADLDEVELPAKRGLSTEDSRVTADWFRRSFH